MSGFLDSLAKYQDIMKQLQTQAKKLMMVSNGNISFIRGLMTTLLFQEIKSTHSRVLQSLAESQIAKKNFLELKQKAEVILSQLQEEAWQAGVGAGSQVPLYATVRKDRGKGRGAKVTRNTMAEPPAGSGEDSPYQLRPRSLMMSYKH